MTPPAERVLVVLAESMASLAPRTLQGLWVFGSRSRGNEGPDSDLDLALLCTPPLEFERTALGDRMGRALALEVDVVDLGSCDPILAWEVITSGRLLREWDELAVERFVREARFRAEDADQRNRMILLALGRPR